MHKNVFFVKKMLFPVLLLQLFFKKTTVSVMTINSCATQVFLKLKKDSSVCSIFLPSNRYANFQARHILEAMQLCVKTGYFYSKPS